ncbi:hypothetical protein EU99_0249 [Prochlorococcus marinus str. MIT 9321]|uniref:Uncharacterized protein n=1 Tax=Prochlorococcus marinus str. MIT 9401 TaxID=167551 RepID=A0A0A2B2X4_PROMR|nr:hypothetical protein EV00_1989 [Prochlorococcus marinus str. MIT 9322]KGG05679.1 hypothetical protein EU99_0249 [Prochlorococcus marinus str. MIT 9321]KGG07492.1 hypothetical protein EV01_1107 [Prochlorococcus marinus str. MIT 9401]
MIIYSLVLLQEVSVIFFFNAIFLEGFSFGGRYGLQKKIFE